MDNHQIKHGHSKRGQQTPEYLAWKAMKQRCYNENYEHYDRYGGRGIEVCDRWLDSFSNFLKDMGERPEDKTSLDRIDNDGDYSPDNCRWATQKEQCNNQKRNVTYQGETIAQAARRLGIDQSAIVRRLQRGWSKEDAFTKTATKKPVTHNGENMSEAAERLGISHVAIINRLDRGWSKEKAFNTPAHG